jgi:hypothetical protein
MPFVGLGATPTARLDVYHGPRHGERRMAAQNTGRFCEWQVGILFVEGESEAEIARRATALSAGGAVLMPLDDYGLSPQFTWVSDRLGVSWQLNLACIAGHEWNAPTGPITNRA